MARRLTKGELQVLRDALTNGWSISDIASNYNVSEDVVQQSLDETGITLPGADDRKLTSAERDIYLDTVAGKQSAWDVALKYNKTPEQLTSFLDEAGLTVPLASGKGQGDDNAFSGGNQGYEDEFLDAQRRGLTTEQTATEYGVPEAAVRTILGAAGRTLSGASPTGMNDEDARPGRVPGADVPDTAQPGNQGSDPDYPGGLPQQQDAGGMYGETPDNETPSIVGSFIPQLPGLRMVRQNARRRNGPNWRGQTDTILTSGQGLTGSANTRVRTLLGS